MLTALWFSHLAVILQSSVIILSSLGYIEELKFFFLLFQEFYVVVVDLFNRHLLLAWAISWIGQ